MKCYYCREWKNEEIESGESPFCNELEHLEWANKHYGTKGNPRKSLSIKEMQERLLEMGNKKKTTTDRPTKSIF